MCGITGYIDFSGISHPDHLRKMTASLSHRGPDDDGVEFRIFEKVKIGFGFRRLSIIDLSSLGHQPMINESNGDIIIFNGEVYNFREIRNELEKKGHHFKSLTDTEVILKSFQEWGNDCVSKFNGMFAIAIFNPLGNKVQIFRDRAGVKPLFYYWDGNLFLFGSELKALHQHPGFRKKINFDSLALYFHHGYIPNPYSIFENTFKLPPGNRLEIDLRKKLISTHRYWSILDAFNKPKVSLDYEEAIEELDKLLVSAFKYRMISDVPVGVFLSGGYDSTAVASIIQQNTSARLKTFTIGFEDQKFNEAHHAKAVAEFLGTDHHEYICSEKEALDIIPFLPEIYDEPMADGGAIPNILVCKMAKKEVTVVLSADGGDEIFAGYTKHFYAKQQIARYLNMPEFIKKAASQTINVLNLFRDEPLYKFDRLSRLQNYLNAKDSAMLFNHLNQTFTEHEITTFLKKKTAHLYNHFMDDHLLNFQNDEVDRIIAIDFKTFLVDDILQKVDRATSFVSLEGREPLLDHRIVEFAATLPSNYKLRSGVGKSILRDVVHKYVPKTMVDRPKTGFGLPISTWGLKELKPVFDEYFELDFLRNQKIFSANKVRSLYDYYLSGHEECFDRVWEIFIFQQWYKKWMN